MNLEPRVGTGAVILLVAAITLPGAAPTDPQPSAQRFKTGVDLVRLDVSVPTRWRCRMSR